MGNDCANCPYISNINKELKDHKEGIDSNKESIIELKSTTERNEERFLNILSAISDLKKSFESFQYETRKDLGRVDKETAVNSTKIGFKIDLNWKTISAIGVVLTMIGNQLLSAFVK